MPVFPDENQVRGRSSAVGCIPPARRSPSAGHTDQRPSWPAPGPARGTGALRLDRDLLAHCRTEAPNALGQGFWNRLGT